MTNVLGLAMLLAPLTLLLIFMVRIDPRQTAIVLGINIYVFLALWLTFRGIR